MGNRSIAIWTLHNCRIDTACFSEVRYPNSNWKRVKFPGPDTICFLHHCEVTENSGLYGVSVALSERANDALISWKPVCTRTSAAHFKVSTQKLTVIAGYAPTKPVDNTTTDVFCDARQRSSNGVPRGRRL